MFDCRAFSNYFSRALLLESGFSAKGQDIPCLHSRRLQVIELTGLVRSGFKSDFDVQTCPNGVGEELQVPPTIEASCYGFRVRAMLRL